MVWWHHQLDGHEFEQALGVVMDREAWPAAVHGVAKKQTGLSNWTELNWLIGRTDPEAEAPILWPPDVKSWPIGKDPDAGKDCEQEEKGAIGNEVVGWHHWLHGDESDQTLGDGEGQEAWYAAVHRAAESDAIQWLNNYSH